MCSLSNIFVHVCIGSFSRILYCLILFQILSSIIALLREHPKAHILTTGHSLGSIFATFVAIDVKANVRHYDYNDYLLNPNAYTLFPNDTGVERGFYSYSSTIRRKRSDYDHNIQIASVYTFGLPRIGNSILADFIHSEIRISLSYQFSISSLLSDHSWM